MGKCESKTGFFVLRDCDEASVSTCSECGRQICETHRHNEELCLECNQTPDFKLSEAELSELPKENMSPQQQRTIFYNDKKGSGIYLGQELNTYYQHFDLRSFDIELMQLADSDEEPEGGFYDS